MPERSLTVSRLAARPRGSGLDPLRPGVICAPPVALTRKLGPRWARGSEPRPVRWRGSGRASVVRRVGPGAGTAAAPGLAGMRAVLVSAGRLGGLRGTDGDGAAGVELLQLAQQVGL